MNTPQNDHKRATPHQMEREPLKSLESSTRDVLKIAIIPGLIVAIVAIIFINFLK